MIKSTVQKICLTLTAFLMLGASVYAQTINGAGASFPYPVYSSWAYLYEQQTKIKVNYQSIGSGGGIKQVTEGVVNFGASDDPLTSEQLKKSNLMQFPAVLGGVVPVINVKGIKSNEIVLTGKLMADIFHGKVKKWNDPAIKAINKNVKLPDATINVVYRSDSSGTSAIFTKYLSEVSTEWSKEIGAGKSVNWPVGVGAKGNDGVAGTVKKVNNSISYVEYAYAEQNKIAWAGLVNKSGKTVYPTAETFKNAAANAKWDKTKDYYMWVVNTDGNKSWPITAATFILIKKDKQENIEAVRAFFDWCFKNGDKTAVDLQYIPLPDSLKNDIRSYWK